MWTGALISTQRPMWHVFIFKLYFHVDFIFRIKSTKYLILFCGYGNVLITLHTHHMPQQSGTASRKSRYPTRLHDAVPAESAYLGCTRATNTILVGENSQQQADWLGHLLSPTDQWLSTGTRHTPKGPLILIPFSGNHDSASVGVWQVPPWPLTVP